MFDFLPKLPDLNALKGYRTLIVNAVAVVVGLLVAFGVLSPADAAGFSPDAVGAKFDAIVAAIMTLLGAVNMLLRLITNTKAGRQPTE
jgi:Mg2+/Co2+ transporter CorB